MNSLARAAQAVVMFTSLGLAQDTKEPVAADRVPALLATLRSSAASENARLEALGRVASYMWRTNGDAATRKQILAGVYGLLTEESPKSLTIGALRTLQALGLPRTLNVLGLECDAVDRSVDVRLVALEAAARVGGVAAVPTLTYALGDPDPMVVDEAGRWLERVCWVQGDHQDPEATWRSFFHTEAGETVLVAAFTRLRRAVGRNAEGISDGIPTHIVALVLDDDLGDTAWREAYRCLGECVSGFAADPTADRKRAVAAVRDAWPSVRVFRRSATGHEHGTAQLSRMLADRPAMSLHVKQGDKLWLWAVQHFGEEELGFRVYWRSEPPSGGFDADHVIPMPATVASVRIRSIVGESPACAFERYWRALVYEMNNLRNAAAFRALYDAALRGQLDRDTWIRQCTMLEFKAVERLRQFYGEAWRPWADREGVSATPEVWFVGAGETHEEWLSRYSRPDGYPNAPFGSYWDEKIAPFLAARKCEAAKGAAAADGAPIAQLVASLSSPIAPQEARLRALDEAAASLCRSDVDAAVKGEVVRGLVTVLGERRAFLGGSSEVVRAAAYVKLAAVAASDVVEVPKETRLVALRAIAEIGGVAAIPTLLHALADKNAAVADAASRWLERTCWGSGSEHDPAGRWHAFFRTEDGEKMLVAAYAKLRGAIGSAAQRSTSGVLAHVVASVLDEELGERAWLEAYRYLTECAAERFATDPKRDRKGTTAAVRAWWSSK